MSRLVLATNNAGKVKEIRKILEDAYDEIVSLSDLGLDVKVEEDGDTFEENAAKKAIEISKLVDGDVLADDSGLVVKALGGAPGVRSARFAGEDANDAANNAKLIEAMRGQKERSAKFVCCMVLANNGTEKACVEGTVHGEVLEAPQGDNGFGYDPLFFFPEDNMTFAQLPADRKNVVSHRSKALQALKETLASNKNTEETK